MTDITPLDLQRAMNALGSRLTEDGQLGPKSRAELMGYLTEVARFRQSDTIRAPASGNDDLQPETIRTGSQELPAVDPVGSRFQLSHAANSRLNGVHPDLVKVVRRLEAIGTVPFTVLEGLRTTARQQELYKSGASKTLNSRHLTGHAVDIAPLINGAVSWHWPHYRELEPVMKRAAKDVGIDVEWGGDWESFKDGPHWQLPRNKYP